MVRRLVCCLSVLSLSVAVAAGSDEPQDAAPLVPPTASPQPAPAAPARLPQAGADPSLSPIEHLRRAADHLDAADVGDLSIDMHDEAKQLRERADQLEQGATKKLAELRKQLEEIQDAIRHLEQFTTSTEQIQLDIVIAELDMTKLRRLGFEWEAMLANAGGIFTQTAATSYGAIQFEVVNGDGLQGLLDAMVEQGLAKILAEPKLVTTSGREASIHTGGEFHLPVLQDNGAFGIEWHEYGVRTYALPVILENGRLKLTLAPELIERDFSRTMTVEGITVPSLTTRRVNAEVEMDYGQTFLIGGLISTTQSPPTFRAVPIPDRDGLFKQVELPRHEIKKQLVVLVTPTRIEPSVD